MLMIITDNISAHSAGMSREDVHRPRRCTKTWEHPARLTEEAAAQGKKRFPHTCEQEAGDCHGIQLLGGGDVIAIQEVVQQVDGQVPGRGAELAVAAQQGQDVHKEPPALQERGVGSEGRQLQFLERAG